VSLSLADVRRVTADVARQHDPALDVLGAIPAEEGVYYSEVILTIRGCATEPCRVVIGVSREASEKELGETVKERLQEHWAEHGRASAPTP